jgi:cysteinyl-tRNA synthetase
MALQVHNTLTKRKEEFKPIDDKKIKMYVCGVTVYDDIHMGHARHIVVFDMIVRYLRYSGFRVTHVTNFTDVDDKIINRAKELGVPPLQLSKTYIDRYFSEVELLGVKRADVYPKASEFIPQIIDMVRRIEAAGFAYQAGDGSVYFSMDKVRDYGKLSGMKMEELIAGARVGVDESKRNPMDFALWKAVKTGEISWPSPWGPGRPGWHIECSAMCMNLLGDTIDIHGGGNDLIFPHHENEILQSWSVTHKPLANYWIHNGMLQIQEEKMSKSLKNFFTVRQVLDDFTKEDIRFFILNTHYRGPLNFSEAAMEESAASLRRLNNTYCALRGAIGAADGDNDAAELVEKARQGFIESMDDDFNTRAAISGIFDLARETNRLLAEGVLSREGDRPSARSACGGRREGGRLIGDHPDPDRGKAGTEGAEAVRPRGQHKGQAPSEGHRARGYG